jgi:Flp pilus assembly protein TadD
MRTVGKPMDGRRVRTIWGIKVLLLFLVAWGAAGVASAAAQETSQGQHLYDQGLSLLKAGNSRQALPPLQKAIILLPNNRHVMADYVVALVWAGEYRQAVAYYRIREPALREIGYLHKNIAKAFFELRDFARARELYAKGWQVDPKDAEAFKGLVYSCCRLEDFVGATRAWEKARRENIIPATTLATMKVFILKTLGAYDDALKTARDASLKDKRLLQSLEGDVAVERLRWDELDQALTRLEAQVAQQPENWRARQDYIVALRKKDRMREVLQQYALYQKSGQPVPYWVNEAVADAYLYLKQPRQAAEYYRLVLKQHPEEPFDPLEGLFYTQVELRQWQSAAATLQQITEYLRKQREAFNGKYFSVPGANLFEYQNNEATRLQGLFLLFKDKNREAAEYFTGTLAKAGLDTGLRNGLGEAYFWQKRSRQALEQYKISQGVDTKDKDSRIGMAYALDTLNYKNEARDLAQQLYQQFPTNAQVQNLYETLRIEDRPYLSFDYYFTREYQGAVEHYLVSELNAAIVPTFRVFSQIIWQEAREDQGGETLKSVYNRLAFGFDWIVVPQLTLRQAVGFDYLKGNEVGSYTKVQWRPTDPLKITGEFDSFSLSVPIRARARGVAAKEAALAVTYTESDLRDYGIASTLYLLDDNNQNPGVTAFFNQTVLNYPDVKVRAGFRANYYRYTRDNVDYFSPLFDYTFLFTPSIHWTLYQFYDRLYRTSLYLRGGVNKQIGFDFFPVAGCTLEQRLEWSKTFALTATVSYDQQLYNGVYSHVLGAYVGFKKYF